MSFKRILQWFRDRKYRNAPMVGYWKYADAARAKVTVAPDRHYYMFIEGEKYPFPGFPRGALLVGKVGETLDGGTPGYSLFAQTKHIIKNFIFNESWARLEKGQDIAERIKGDGMQKLIDLAHANRYLMLPPDRMVPPVKEIHRAFTVVAKEDKRILALRDILTFVLQEDDGYRFRVQWLAKFIPWIRLGGKMSLQIFAKGLSLMEHAEIVQDMRERVVLLRKVLLALLEDKKIRSLFNEFCKEVNWKKVKLSEADKYYLRAKYFRCDYPEFRY